MLLEMKNISKNYGSLLANDNINLTLNKGEILAVVGENGAGKSTLMKILYGLERPTAGEIHIEGKRMSFRNPSDAMDSGIGMVQQHFMLLEPYTVAENIVYKREPKKNIFFFDKKRAFQIVEELCKKYSLHVDPRARVEDCAVGLQQRVEILKILYQDANIIIFDEPSAVLTPQEVRELLKTMKQLAAMGKSVIIITHKLHEVMEVSDRVMVMRAGKLVKEMATKDTNIEELSFLMVGRQILSRKVPPQATGQRILTIDGLVMKGEGGRNVVDGASLYVDAGEIVGIAGVSGNGQSELIRAVTGLAKADGGRVTLMEQEVLNRSVGQIRKSGLAHIPEDRYLWGCAREATLIETGIMAHHRKPEFSKGGIIDLRTIRWFVQGLLTDYGVMNSGLNQRAGELSGGNNQKLIVAREIAQKSPLLIACEPTRGVDVGAMEFIHDKLVEKRERGDGVLLVSSELSEIMSLCDRIYVLFEGKVNGEFTREMANEEQLGLLMMGGGAKHESA